MNAFAAVSSHAMSSVVSTTAMPASVASATPAQVHAATLITRELTLQRNRNRILAASHTDLLNEIARLRQENADLEKIACIDSLTGVFNRHMLMQEIERSIKSFQRGSTSAVMLLIDLNRFKRINDEFGHAAGDKALRAAASHLSSSVRATDSVARLGGDEFVVILNNTNTADALHIADKLYRGAPAIEHQTDAGTVSIALHYSIGHATLSSDTSGAEAWLQAADVAMYRTKFFEQQKR